MHPISLALGPHARVFVPVTALVFIVLEYALGRLTHHDTHDLRESAATLGVVVGQGLLRGVEALLVAAPFALAAAHSLLTFRQASPVAIAVLFVATEFVYYWHHRLAHRVRWLWATHSVHHSPTRLNLSAAARLGWTGSLSGNFLFFLPLVWIGFQPFAVFGMLGLNLLYQFLIHTELAPRLGPLEWVFNTPAHHRVHHAANPSCLDRNYGGVLIVFDRIFGTFATAPSNERLYYGVAGGHVSFNPVRIALGEWAVMARDFVHAQGAREKFAALFGPPRAHPTERA